jgi:hypothetical protein
MELTQLSMSQLYNLNNYNHLMYWIQAFPGNYQRLRLQHDFVEIIKEAFLYFLRVSLDFSCMRL